MIADYAFADSAEGHFAHGTYAHMVVALLGHSLDYIAYQGLGVPAIQAHAQTLIDHFKEELPRLGYTLMTPKDMKTPIVACAYEGAREKLGEKIRGREESNSRPAKTASGSRRRSSTTMPMSNARCQCSDAPEVNALRSAPSCSRASACRDTSCPAAGVAFHREVRGHGRIEGGLQHVICRTALSES